MKRVLVVQGEGMVRAGLVRLLCEEPSIEIVGECGHGRQGMALLRKRLPDVAIIDLGTPGVDGPEYARRVTRAAPTVNVLAVATPWEGPYPATVLEAGALGYITRDCGRRDLLEAVERVAVGRSYLAPKVAEQLLLARLGRAASPLEDLSPREVSVMIMISLARDRRAISDSLCISPKTVSTYRSRVLRKLGASGDVELTHLSLRHGLLEPEQIGMQPR